MYDTGKCAVSRLNKCGENAMKGGSLCSIKICDDTRYLRSGTRGMNGVVKMSMEKTLCVTSLIQFSRLVNQSAPSA